MGEAERAGSRLRETRGRVRLDLGVEWMICNRGVWVWDGIWEWENVEEKVKARGAGKGGCDRQRVRVRVQGSSGSVAGRKARCCCVLLLREAIQPARGVLPTEVLEWGGPKGRGRGKMSGGKFESQLEGENPKNQGDTAAKWTGGAVNGTFWGWPKRIRGKGRGRGRGRGS